MNKREKRFLTMAVAGAMGLAGLGLLQAKPKDYAFAEKLNDRSFLDCRAPDFIVNYALQTGGAHGVLQGCDW